MKKKPRPHQQKALRDIVPSITRKKLKRLTVIMPCGTGKTLVQLWTAEATKPKTVLVLLPSLALLRQTLREWMAETSWKKPEVLCVCSDQTVGRKSEDEINISPEDIGYPVTSDGEVVAAFLAKKSAGTKLVFSTYHSSPLVAVGMGKNFSFDLAIFDEAHTTAGLEGGFFSFALEDTNLPIKVRTFWTATPRHYSIDKVDAQAVYSMDDKSVYGPQVYKLAFREAVRQGIICDYEVLVSVVTNKMLGTQEINDGQVVIDGEKVSAKVVAHQVALSRAIRRYGIRKIFSFHPRVADAAEFTNDGPQSVAGHIPKDFRVFHVNGAMTVAEREEKIGAFRKATRALMSNARCLTQGIDVPVVDLVAFFSKKRSLIDIVQATGRAMRRAPGKSKGYILVPLYIEQEQGETLEEAVQRSDFREVWAVLNAMREQDETLAETMSRIRTEEAEDRREDREPRDLSIDKVAILGLKVEIENLRRSITTICVDRLARTREVYKTWEEASAAARKLGIDGVNQYQCRYKEDPRLPANPHLVYAAVWNKNGKWKSFVGRRSIGWKGFYTWKEASAVVQNLGIKTTSEYDDRYKEDPRLPSNPQATYRAVWDKNGGPQGFLRSNSPGLYPNWTTASRAAQKLKAGTREEYLKLYKKDPRLCSTPNKQYVSVWKKKGGWSGFLATKRPRLRKYYPTWKEASVAARRLGISLLRLYKKRYKEDPKLPSTPSMMYERVWEKNGGWPGFLGTLKQKN